MSNDTGGISTYGWHTVTAVTYADINKALVKTTLFPAGFTYTVPGPAPVNAIAGTFTGWKLTTGGSGPKLKFSATVASGTKTLNGVASNLVAGTVVVEVEAGFIPQPGADNKFDLKLQSGVPVNVVATSPAQGNFADDQQFKMLFQQWLRDNLSAFNHVFASVDLDADYAKVDAQNGKGLAWLKPSWVSYAVAEPSVGPTEDNCVFAVLSMIDDTALDSIPRLSQEVSLDAIPPGCRAGFLIAPEKFLRHMLLAAMPLMFVGITDDALATTEAAKNFIIDNGGTRIINRNPLTMNQVTLDNGNTVSPVVDAGNFSLTVDTDELELAFTDMTFEYSTGITMHLGFSSRGKIILNSTTAGPESLDLAIVTQKITPPYTTIDAGLAKTTLILSVVTAAVTAVSGGLAFYAKAAATAASRAATVGEAGADAASNAGREVSQSMEADGSIEMQSISREAGAVVPAMTRAEIQAMVTATATNILSRAAVPVGALATWAPRVAKVALALAFCNGVSAGIIKSLQDIAEHRYDSMPNINSLLAGAIGSTVQWPAAMDSYTLYNAQLNEALQFGLK